MAKNSWVDDTSNKSEAAYWLDIRRGENNLSFEIFDDLCRENWSASDALGDYPNSAKCFSNAAEVTRKLRNSEEREFIERLSKLPYLPE